MTKTKTKTLTKIFLIEDNSAIIDVYSLAFDAAGIAFEVITTGNEALSKIKNIQESKEEAPALILLDLMLPDINGMEILKEIRQNEVTKKIVVFVLSNYTVSADQKSDAVKADKYLMKTSVKPTELIALIKEQIS